MSYTSHGHHIPGTPKHTKPPLVAKCGGAMACAQCAKETSATLIKLVETEEDAPMVPYAWQLDREDGNLVAHARRELELLGEEPATIEWYLSVVRAFCAFGHSGGSSSVMIPVLNDLLQYKNLKPLTNNPKEWMDRKEESGMPLWQNIRCSEAFSEDGGKTYWLLNTSTAVTYESEPHQEDAQEATTVSGG